MSIKHPLFLDIYMIAFERGSTVRASKEATAKINNNVIECTVLLNSSTKNIQTGLRPRALLFQK